MEGGLVVKVLTMEEVLKKIPETIYKYRCWNNPDYPEHNTIITKQALFFSSPEKFEDKLDCRLQKNYDLLTEEDIYNKYYAASKIKNPFFSESQHQAYANEWSRNSPTRDKSHIKRVQEDAKKRIEQQLGVLSMTENSHNLVMWEKYADKRKGICVGFDSRIIAEFKCGGGNAIYYDTLPVISPLEDYNSEFHKIILSKEKKWEFEDELRLFKMWMEPATKEDRTFIASKGLIKEVIFGELMPRENKLEIIIECQDAGINCTFYDEKNGEKVKFEN